MPDGLTSWREVERIALALRDAGWIFRGQSNPWPLQPAVGRAAAGGGLASSPAAERAMLEEFKQRARRQMADVEVPASDLEWLALARSHGLPTRLLDWSLDPYVAIYFALIRCGVSCLPQLYAVPRPAPCPPGAGSFAIEEPHSFVPARSDPRSWRQRLVYTVHPWPILPFHPESLKVWPFHISTAEWRALRSLLFDLGYSPGRLVPGLQGIAAQIAWQFEPETMS
jgi:hypothetical protein